MTSPDDQKTAFQNLMASISFTNGRGLLTGAVFAALLSALMAYVVSVQTYALPHVQGIAALQAYSVSVPGNVVLDYRVTPGDAPAVEYYPVAGVPDINAGAGDGGAEILSNTPNFYWHIGALRQINFLNWGVTPGGLDPNGMNATQINAAISYGCSQRPTGTVVPYSTEVTGGAKDLYGVGSQINFSCPIHYHHINLTPTAAMANTCATQAVVYMAGASTYKADHIFIDLNYTPGVDGWHDGTNGSVHRDNIQIRRWMGTCTQVSLSGTTVAGSNIVTMPSTTGMVTGMLSHGNVNLPAMTTVVGVYPGYVVVSNPASGSGTGSLTFSTDATGFTCGWNGANCGGTFSNFNVFEWFNSDANRTDPALRYGHAVFCTGNCNDVYFLNGLFQGGADGLFEDQGTGGVTIDAMEINNGAFSASTPGYNPTGIQLACGAGPLRLPGPVNIGGAGIGVAVCDSTVPRISSSNLSFTPASTGILNPSAMFQFWTNQGAPIGTLTGSAAAATSNLTGASIAGNTLTFSSGTAIIGSTLSGTGVAGAPSITSCASGTSCTISGASQTVASTTITMAYSILTVTGTPSTPIALSQYIIAPGLIGPGSQITMLGTGTGGAGTYYLANTSANVPSGSALTVSLSDYANLASVNIDPNASQFGALAIYNLGGPGVYGGLPNQTLFQKSLTSLGAGYGTQLQAGLCGKVANLTLTGPYQLPTTDPNLTGSSSCDIIIYNATGGAISLKAVGNINSGSSAVSLASHERYVASVVGNPNSTLNWAVSGNGL